MVKDMSDKKIYIVILAYQTFVFFLSAKPRFNGIC